MRSTASLRSVKPVRAGSKSTVAVLVARLTAARPTPGCCFRTFSTLAAHEAHVMPDTVKVSCLSWAGAASPCSVDHRSAVSERLTWLAAPGRGRPVGPRGDAVEPQRLHQLVDDLLGSARGHGCGHTRLEMVAEHQPVGS